MRNIPELLLMAASVLTIGRVAYADTTIIDSELADSYDFVDTYEILVDAAPEDVWPHLVDVASWMYEFSMIHESGPRHAEGEVLRLYEGEDYLLQVVKLVPEKLMICVNLPLRAQGEELTGVGMFTLTEVGGQTLVSSFMARHSYWVVDGPNTLGETRRSAQFQQQTGARWNRFLNRLRELVEGTYTNP